MVVSVDPLGLKAQGGGACTVETVLGGPVFAGDGGPASNARFVTLTSIAVGTDGSLIVADSYNHRVRQIGADRVQTIAGNGMPQSDGDGGLATLAGVRFPQFVALHANGTLGVIGLDGQLRETGTDGRIRTVTTEKPESTMALAVGPDGSYYVGSTALPAGSVAGVRRIFPDGRIEVAAGNGDLPEAARAGEGLPAVSAPIGTPTDLAIDSQGRLWILEMRPTPQIRRVETDGTISTIAGGGSRPLSEAPLDALSALLSGVVHFALIPGTNDAYVLVQETLFRLTGGRLERVEQIGGGDIAVDAAGNVFLATGERVLRRGADGVTTQLAGPPRVDSEGAEIPADAPVVWLGVSVAPDGDVLPFNRRTIYRWRPGDALVRKIAGNGQGWNTQNDMPALDSGFNSIRQVAGDSKGGVYVADDLAWQLRYIDPSGIMRRAAGTDSTDGLSPLVTSPVRAVGTRINRLDSVAVGPDETVYFTEGDRGRNRVFRLGSDGMMVEYPLESPGRIPNADAVAVGFDGRAYVLERSLGRTFRLGATSSDVTQGPPVHPETLRTTPTMAIDEEESLYWLDGSVLWRARSNGVTERITSLSIGSQAEGASATQFRMSARWIAISTSGDLFFVDTGAGRVRKIRDVSSCTGLVQPLITREGVVNGAHFLRLQSLSPGEIVSLFGVNLGPLTPALGRFDQSGRLASDVDGVRVLVDGTPAPIVFASSGQTTFVTPNEIGERSDLVVEYNGQRSDILGLPFAFELGRTSTGPGLFTLDYEPSGRQAAALNQDGSINGPNNPARPGEAVVLFGTGAGKMTPELPNGSIVGSDLPRIDASVRVEIGGREAKVLYAGGAPGLVYGVAQINALIPEDLEITGRVKVVVFVDSAPSYQNVVIEVRK